MENIGLIQKLVLSVLLGFLIGLEREKQKQKQKYLSFGGIRTFPLIALFGGLSAHLSNVYASVAIVIAAFAALALLVIVTHAYYSFEYKHSGITSEMSAILTFFIGVSTILLPNILSISSAILLTLLLSLKKPLHKFSRDLGKEEFYAAIKFVVISFIILPLLPDKTIDPWHLFNPYKIWLSAVIISAISFAGYISVKMLDPKRGTYVTGFIGGIVSSTGTTSNFAKRARDNTSMVAEYRNGALLSYVSSIIKVSVVLFVLNQNLFFTTISPLLTVIGTGLLLSIILIKKSKTRKKKYHLLELKNPFTLTFALKFALLLTIILSVAQLAAMQLGNMGIYITSIISGFAKIDAITVSMAELGGKTISYDLAKEAMMIGIFFSAISKSFYSLIFGGRTFAKAATAYFIITGLSGLIIIFI